MLQVPGVRAPMDETIVISCSSHARAGMQQSHPSLCASPALLSHTLEDKFSSPDEPAMRLTDCAACLHQVDRRSRSGPVAVKHGRTHLEETSYIFTDCIFLRRQ